MKILYISDLHADFKNLECAKAYSDRNIHPDVTIVSGDLADSVFSIEEAEKHLEIFEKANAVAESEMDRRFSVHGFPVKLSPYEKIAITQEIARQIILKKHYPDNLKDLARTYLHHLYSTAGKNYEAQYSKILEIMGEDIIVLPGNYDTNLEINYDISTEKRESALHKQNIHKKVKTIDDIVIAGYGGAASAEGIPISPLLIPQEITVFFNEYIEIHPITGKVLPVSEPLEFLNKVSPHIALTHSPPKGICDESKNGDHAGSWGIEAYVKTGKSKILLCGHIYEGKGIRLVIGKEGNTVVVNPGSLSSENGQGTFAVIELAKDAEFQNARIYKVVNPNDFEYGVFHEESYIATPLEIKEISLKKP